LAVIRGDELSKELRKLWERFEAHETEFIEFFSIELPNSDDRIDIDGILQLIGQSTARERKATDFIHKNGGIEAIARDTKKYNELSTIVGEKVDRSLLQLDLTRLLDGNKKDFARMRPIRITGRCRSYPSQCTIPP